MSSKPRRVTNSLVMYGSIILLLACNSPSSENEGQRLEDVESAYFNLSKEAQAEVMGAQVKPISEMRKDLLAKADTDSDGQLSDEEKAALRAEWKDLKEQMKAELKAELDVDQDREISKDELKAGLDNMGQKIKAVIQTKHEEMRVARQAARERIKAACGQGARLQKSESDQGEELSADIKAELEQCQAIAREEKDKLHTMLKDSLAALKQELDELKAILVKVESQSATI